MFRPTLITPPTTTPVSIDELKARIPGLTFNDDDAALTALVGAAVGHFDGYRGTLGRCIEPQTWRQFYGGWHGALRLPFPDVSGVVVKYSDVNGDEQTVSADDYELVSHSGGDAVVFLGGFDCPALYDDTTSPVWVDLTAGFANVPDELVHAIVIVARSLYEAEEELPAVVDCLTMPLRCVRI